MITRIYNCNSEFINGYGLVTHIVATFGDKIAYMRLYDTGDEILWEFDKEKLVSVSTYYTRAIPMYNSQTVTTLTNLPLKSRIWQTYSCITVKDL